MERRGSGLKKIVNETQKLPGYTDALRPVFTSTSASFRVTIWNVNYGSDQVSDQVSDQDDQDVFAKILRYCAQERSKKEICEHFGYNNLTYFTRKFLAPLLDAGSLRLTIPETPNSRNQKYIAV